MSPGSAEALLGILLLGLFLAAYAIPEILMHALGLFTVTSSRRRGAVAITFDDGPHPVYTPMILDALRDRNFKATFFVLGKKAAAYPEVMERIVREGHEVAVHGWDHRHPWLMGPVTSATCLRKALHATKAYRKAQDRPKYRPCWGFWTLWLALCTRSMGRIMWSLPGNDWKRGATPESVKKHVSERARDGDIVLLHDGGKYSWITAQALPGILDTLSHRGLLQVTVDELRRA